MICLVELCPSGGPKMIGDSTSLLLLAPSTHLHNIVELRGSLALGPEASQKDIILAGWKRWGEKLPSKLRGQFAFVLEDGQGGSVFVARDHFGLAPLFWRQTERALCFATSSTEIRRSERKTQICDEVMLADFVAGAYIERSRTFFLGIERFPEAHWLRISSSAKVLNKYWATSEISPFLEQTDPVEQFRELFDRSVRANSNSDAAAIMLSGGLDSSAIAASLAHMGASPTQALSLTYTETDGWSDESHLYEVAAMTGLSVQPVPADLHDPLRDIEFWLRAVDGPYLPRGHSVSTQLLPMARKAGATIVFSGHGGDEVVSYGFGRLNELAREGKWLTLWNEIEAFSALYGDNKFVLFRRYLSHIRRLRPLVNSLARKAAATVPANESYLAEGVANEMRMGRYELKSAGNRLDHTERMLHEEALSSALQPCSLEIYALCGEAVGIQTKMPFYNVELVEFSLSLPSIWKLQGGFSRYILRRAFEHDLPKKTLQRRDKFDFTNAFINGLVAQREKVLDLTDPHHADRWGIVNHKSLREARDKLFLSGNAIDPSDAFFLWRIAVLAMWGTISLERPQPIQSLTNRWLSNV